jgi:hypothetical protein
MPDILGNIGILTATFLGGVAIIGVAINVIALIGGIYALQRKKWGLVLAGSIAAIFSSTILGILATIFTAVSKDEFE